MLELTGLWKSEKANGDAYMSGSLGLSKIFVFKNGYKKKDTDPDYILYIAERKKVETKEATDGEDIPF